MKTEFPDTALGNIIYIIHKIYNNNCIPNKHLLSVNTSIHFLKNNHNKHKSKTNDSNVQRKIYEINKCIFKSLQFEVAKLIYNL